MATLSKEINNYVETLVSVFTIENGEIKVLLKKNEIEPYKGYWTLPGNFLNGFETLEQCIEKVISNETGLNNVKTEQAFTFSNLERNPEGRVLATSYMGLVDNKNVELRKEEISKKDVNWFSIDSIPKMAYDHEEIANYTINYLKKQIRDTNVLKTLFSSDFTLPELQKVYEQILDKKLDRRNFRKKFISLDLIEDTNEKNIGCNGRPAKLYRFKENIKQVSLF